MKTNKYDQELIFETMSECNEQIDKTIPILIEIEKHELPFNIDIYNEIFRTLHSIKGCLSMVGLTTESEVIHQCESLFRQCSDGHKFHQGIIQITIEFLNHLSDFFSGNKSAYFELVKTKNCFKCIIKENFLKTCSAHGKGHEGAGCSSEHITNVEDIDYINEHIVNVQNSEKVCPKPPEIVEKIMLIGDNRNVEEYLKRNNTSFTKLADLEQAYLLGKRLMQVETFLLDVTNCGGNCLSFVLAVNSIAPAKKILLLSDSKIPNFNDMLIPEKMSFMFTGTSSRNFFKTLNYFISAA